MVITSDDVDGDKKLKAKKNEILDGIEVHRHPLLFGKRMRELWYISGITAELRSLQADIVHTNGYRCLCSFIATLWCGRNHVPAVHTSHGIYPPRSLANYLIKSFYDHSLGSLLLKYSTKMTALTENNKQLLRGFGVPESKIAIVPNGVDIDKFSKKPPDWLDRKEQGSTDPVLLYVGRIDWNKGLENVVEALPTLKKEFSQLRFLVVGPDYSNHSTHLLDLARRLEVSDSVMMTGEVSEEQKLAYYSRASIFILPAIYEGLSVSLLEAMASRLPVVATRSGGPGDVLIDHISALLLKERSPTEISDSVAEVLRNSELAEKLCENAFQLVSTEFSLNKIVDRLESLYREVLDADGS
jgi:glycosyltransferase involved in cell wall biosynthesis